MKGHRMLDLKVMEVDWNRTSYLYFLAVLKMS